MNIINLLKTILFFIFLLQLSSCDTHKELPGFDRATWLKDEKGCLGKRISIADSIMKYKKLWKGMDDDVLIDLLGTPEKKFYYERNAKAFLYYIEPGNQCSQNTPSNNKQGRKLVAEINATGFINIIRTEP